MCEFICSAIVRSYPKTNKAYIRKGGFQHTKRMAGKEMSGMIRVGIAEDESSCMQELITSLHRYEKENGVNFDIKSFRGAMALLEDYRPVYDILFLDIEMPFLDGLSAAQKIYDIDKHVMIVFVTRIAKYAVQSYDVQAADYILKPLHYPTFSMKLARILRRIHCSEKKFVILQGKSFVRRLATDEICYIEVMDHWLTYYTVSEQLVVKGTMHNCIQELDSETFVRINNCYLINLGFFQGIRGDIAYVNGQPLKISRNRRREFLETVLRYQRGELV